MRCRNCGKSLKSQEKFCTVCGYYNDEEDTGIDLEKEDDTNDSIDESEEDLEDFSEDFASLKDKNEKHMSLDDRYLKDYIGEDYRLIKKSFFNIYAAIFTWIYFLYRKMYIIGSLGLLLTGIIIILYPSILPYYLGIIIIFFGLFFNKIYIAVAKTKIKRIKNKNSETDHYTLQKLMAEKGGVNFLPAIVIYFIFIIIIIINLFSFRLNKEHNTNFWKENSENKANCLSYVKKTYSDLKNDTNTIQITEAACKITQTNTTIDYDIYLKDISTSSNVFYYYQISNGYILHKSSTKNIQELESKSISNNITEEERTALEAKKNIENSYISIYNQSKTDDKLIQKKKNTSEKTNYIFSEDLIHN